MRYLLIFVLALSWGMVSRAQDLSSSIQTGAFWLQEAKKSFAGKDYTQPDAAHLRVFNVSFGSVVANEVVINLDEEGKPLSLQAMVFNKGDDGATTPKNFKALEKQTLEGIEKLTQAHTQYQGGGKRGNAIKFKAWSWKWEHGTILLESSSKGSGRDFQGEFIRLRMAGDGKNLRSGQSNDNISRKDLREHVVTEQDGTVWIKDIPMIDQGKKGYCSVATFARVFALYGMESVDEHVLANLCETKVDGGTPVSATMEAMNKISRKYHTKFLILDDHRSNINALIEPYNKLARRKDKPLVTKRSKKLYAQFDHEILKEVYAEKKSEVNKWIKDMKKHIDKGYPIIWLVLFDRKESPTHIRMIMGYNLKKQTILYSDSWGANHASKPMPAAEARGINLGRYVLQLR